jgi:hypothetical protein
MKLRLEFNTKTPDENGNVFTETVFDSIIQNAKDVPVFLGDNLRPIGIVTDAERSAGGEEVELHAHLDKSRPETEFFEKGHIIFSVSCSYRDMEFEQTGNIRVIKSAKLRSVTIEPGRKYPPTSTIFVMN